MEKNKNIYDYARLIEKWSIDRGLDQADPTKQMLKLIEEVGELASGLNKGRGDEIMDGIGDVFVVLVVLTTQLKINIDDCIMSAYNEIKDRRGRMINGVFVKESDLKEEV